MEGAAPIAIVGIGCRFPGADGPAAFWRLLAQGVDAITEVPKERWSLDELHDTDPAAPGKMNTRWGGFLTDVDRFDAGFFGISPREAVHIDPQQRLLLEVAWEAMEDAGIPVETLAGERVGVFMGVSSYDYGSRQLTSIDEIRDGYVNTGSALSIAANRLSYQFDFRGPSLVIDTACSSSLVTTHYACQSLRRGESTLALAGGVNLILSPAVTIGFSKLQAMAPDGRCKAFDARANGYVRGEGAGVVVLKPLASAIADRDRIYAVIKGGAVNQDGRTNGLTAPNGLSQEALIREALANAGIAPSELHYVEAHGTGTALGDPIELNALGAVLAAGSAKQSRCVVGSAKTNIGHLEAAAGVAGLVKMALSLERGQLPPSLHFEKPNPYIQFDTLPLRVVTRLEPWPSGSGPARGGVSSFGFGGTNAHLVLEEAPARPRASSEPDENACILPISARSNEALASLTRAYAQQLTAGNAAPSLAELCATAAVRRSHHDVRLAAVATTRPEMASKLTAFLDSDVAPGVEAGRRPSNRRRKVAFVFSGQGSQWLGMGRELAATEPVFAAAIARCEAAFAAYVEWSLTAELQALEEMSRLGEVEVVQPAIFAIQVALSELWASWGIKPDAVVGQSMGEVAAAHVAGALSLADAARIICGRSRLAKRASGRGAMAVVELSLSESKEVLAGYEDRLSVAVSGSPTSTVLSGEPDAMEKVLAGLEDRGVFCRRIKVDYASHSPQMDVLRGDLLAMLEGIAPKRVTKPLYSTVTGGIASGRDLGAEYWFRNLREPVLFAGAIEKLREDGVDMFLEVSPHPIVVPSIQQCLSHLAREGLVLGSLRRDEGERHALLSALATFYAAGRAVDWRRVYPGAVECVPLPSYPWQRERFWFDEGSGGQGAPRRSRARTTNPLLGDRTRSAVDPATEFWQQALGSLTFPFLKDHRIDGEIVVPATAYLEMALEAAAEMLGDSGSITLEHIRFEKTLVIPEGDARAVQVAMTRHVPTRFEWQVFAESPASAIDQTPAFSRHAGGQIRVSGVKNEAAVTVAEPLAAIRARCATETTGADHYQRMAEVHLEYGPSFQGIDTVWSGRREAIARLKQAPSDARRYRLHPAIFDAALQVLGAALPPDAGRTLVPVSIDRFHLLNRDAISGDLWAHAVCSDDGVRVRGVVRLLTADGAPVAEANGVVLAPLDAGASLGHQPFYQIAWEKPAQPAALEAPGRHRVLIFADATGVGSSLAERITARGGQAVLVTRDATFAIAGDLTTSGSCCIDATRGEDYADLLAALERQKIRFDSIVHLWSLDVEEASSEAAALGWESGLLLTQALVRSETAEPIRLWFATRGAQRVLAEDDVSPFQAPLWGLARTIIQEHPELACSVVDLNAVSHPEETVLLADALWRADREQQMAFRDDQRFVARLVPVETAAVLSRPGPISGSDPALRAELDRKGDLSSLTFRQIARRRPAPGDVEIEVVAAGLNFRDVLLALGLLPSDGAVVLGHECAGRITALGEGVASFAPGDEVVAIARSALSSFVHTSAALVVKKPRYLDLEEAATLPIAFLTAHYALEHLARLRADERVLIHTATGAVGLASVRIAQAIGAEIYATAGTPEKRALLESLGIHRVMDSRSLSFADEVMEATHGQGVDVIVNSLAGEAFARGLEILRPGGRFVELGKRDLLEGGQLPLRCLEDSRSFFLIDLNSLAARRPADCGRHLQDAVRLFEERQFASLPKQVFAATDLSEAFNHMARGRHIGKVVVRLDRQEIVVAPPTDPAARIRDDGSYVLTGGLGGIALVVAQWLVDNGARHLILVGRNQPSPEALEAIGSMERAGARVVLARLDVADAASLDAAFSRWARELAPLRGVIHAAGVLDDGILIRQTPERFRGVMRAKVDGAWNLHRASLALPLDFFVLFSSAAALLGSAGQSNYAAANQFLDALAHYRRARQLPAVSINWGPWSGVGLAARHGGGARLDADGISTLSPRQGIEAFGRVLLGEMPQVAVMGVDWARWQGASSRLASLPFFSRVAGAGAASAKSRPGLAQIAAASGAELIAMIQARLTAHVASVLRIAVSKIDCDRPLLAMGIDSLMGIELKSRVEREIGITIPLLQLMKGPSITELAHSIAASLGDAGVAAAEAAPREAASRPTGKSLLLSLLSLQDSQPHPTRHE